MADIVYDLLQACSTVHATVYVLQPDAWTSDRAVETTEHFL